MPVAVLCCESHPITMKTTLWFASLLLCFGLAFPYQAHASAPPATPALPEIVQTVTPVFPPQMERVGITSGHVKLVIKVDKTGKLEDLLVTEYTQQPFANEATEAVKHWTFAPAWVGTEAVGWIRELNLSFRADGIMVQLDPTEAPPSRLKMTEHRDEFIGYRACSLRDLDRIPVPRHVVPPTAPLRADAGPVTVEFYIDEEGRVRIPVARQTTDAVFANAAVEAVSQWQFEPPTCKGKPVLVHAFQIFTIKPENPPKE